MKRSILLLIIAILTNCIFTSAKVTITTSAPIIEKGSCGDTILWVLTEKSPNKHELIIAGTGKIEKGCIPKHFKMEMTEEEDLPKLIIKNGITGIGESAFDNSRFTSVIIPNSVASIGEWAFAESRYLKSVTIPNSVTNIGKGAFLACDNLASITIPANVTHIGYGAFAGCAGLKTIIVESGNQYYDNRNNCNAIIETSTNKLISGTNETIIPNSVTSIGVGAFMGRTFNTIIIPNSVTDIEESAFEECENLVSIIIPKNVTSIGEYAFSGCSDLTSVTIENGVASIGDEAFRGCYSLTSITIPNSVTSIGDRAFAQCGNSKSMIVVPGSVTYIGKNAFYYYSEHSDLPIIKLPHWFSDSVNTKDYTNVTFYHPDDDELWNMAKNVNTEDSYKKYLRFSEEKKYAREANKALKRIYSDPEWIEANMWKNVINSNSSKKYLSYLSKYPQGKYADDAKKWLWDNDEDKCWDDVIKHDDIELFDIYLKLYPEGKYKNQAEERKENLLWEEAVAKNTVESYENYLQLYQIGKFRSQAEENIENIRWEQAGKKNSVESYDYYLKMYPQGRFVEKAEKQRSIAEDKVLWKQTTSDASLSAYRRYAETSGAHVNEAKKIIAEMEANGVLCNYVVNVGPKGQKVFYETFLQYPCGNKALSWKYNFGKLKSIAQKGGMLNSDRDNVKDYFLCNMDYRHISVRHYNKPNRIEIDGSCKSVFGVSKLTVLVERLAKIGVLWENNNKPDASGKYKGIYKHEDINVNIELSEDNVIVYVLKK